MSSILTLLLSAQCAHGILSVRQLLSYTCVEAAAYGFKTYLDFKNTGVHSISKVRKLDRVWERGNWSWFTWKWFISIATRTRNTYATPFSRTLISMHLLLSSTR